jgi:uncharacterized protein YqjF (DUF2071 family)
LQDVLFASYAVDPSALRPLVPERFSIDLYGGAAWLTVTPFYAANLRGNLTPPLPLVSSFGSVVVRTCVTCDDKPGLFVFSVDSGSLGAVWTARLFWRLPFWHAKVRISGFTVRRHTLRTPKTRTLDVQFEAERLHGPKAGSSAAKFKAVYKAVSEPSIPRTGTLEQFLIDRYCLYTQSKKSLYRIENHHLPFMLQQGAVDMEMNTLCGPLGLKLPATPDAVLYARNLRLLVWPADKL